MPEFQLNDNARKSHPYYNLDLFAKAYVEAMFFTNCDSGKKDESIANRLGVDRLTFKSIRNIKRDCDDFQKDFTDILAKAYACKDYSVEQAGRDFWYNRQGHGVGFWCREQLKDGIGEQLSHAAQGYGEAQTDIYHGWIYHR